MVRGTVGSERIFQKRKRLRRTLMPRTSEAAPNSQHSGAESTDWLIALPSMEEPLVFRGEPTTLPTTSMEVISYRDALPSLPGTSAFLSPFLSTKKIKNIFYDWVGIKRNIIQAGFVITQSLSLYAFFLLILN